MVNNFPAREREFIKRLAEDLHLHLTWDEYDEQDQNLVVWCFPGADLEPPLTEAQIADDGEENDDDEDDDDDDDGWEDEDDEESTAAVDRVLKKYEKAEVAEDDKEGDFDVRYELSVKEKMDEWKRGYYTVGIFHVRCQRNELTPFQSKLEFSYDDPEQMHNLTYRYVEGLQWVMHYYYSGVASWSWFYNYHYAPRISGECRFSLFQFCDSDVYVQI